MMNIFNIIIVLTILLFGILGSKRGILKEAVLFIGTILVFVISFFLKDTVALFLTMNLPAIKVASSLGTLSSLSILFYQLVSFLILVLVFHFLLRILLSISGLLGKILNLTVILALPNKIFGFLVGAIEGYVITFIALNVLMIPFSGNEVFMNSSFRKYILTETPVLKDSFGGINQALNDILSITQSDNENNTNLMVLDTMLKYKIVSPSYIRTLEKNKKLEDIKNIDSVVDKYEEG